MRATFLTFLLLGCLILDFTGARRGDKLLNKRPDDVTEAKRRTYGDSSCYNPTTSTTITNLNYLYTYSFENFINKGENSSSAYTRYLNAVASFFSPDFSYLEITSIDGIVVTCPNKSCTIGIFERFATNYAIIYNSDVIMPWVGADEYGDNCVLTARSVENADYILPGTNSSILLNSVTLNTWVYKPCYGYDCAWSWLITEWYSLNYLFLPLPTPLYANNAGLRAYPIPSG